MQIEFRSKIQGKLPGRADTDKASQAPKPKTETRIVTRRRLAARREPPPAVPVKVLVDEQAMKSSQEKIAELQARIHTLQTRIEQAVVLAPIAGRVRIGTDGSISIVPEIDSRDSKTPRL